MKLNLKAFALTISIMAGGISLVLNALSVLTGFAKEFFELIAPFHPGYTHTLLGVLISTFWMVVYGYISGAVFVLVYNSLIKE